jgi:hypothetical protein
MSIINVFQSFTPDQWAMIVALAVASPFGQYLATEYSKWLNQPQHQRFKENLNWGLSIGIPALGTIATFLVTNSQVSDAFPIFTSLYAFGQLVYLSSVRFIRKARYYQDMYEKAVKPQELS